MYDKALEEMKKEMEVMAQAKPCPGSERLANKMRRKGSVHHTLYKNAAQKLNKKRNERLDEVYNHKTAQNSYCTFQPQINKRSQKVSAVGKVEDRLVQDAK